MKYQINRAEAFCRICPAFVGAAITADIRNSATNPELWKEIENEAAELQKHLTPDTIKLLPGIEATRMAYKAAGKAPSRYRPACEQLTRRVVQGKGLYAVNTVVDLVNLVSLSSHYSTAALDADRIAGTAIELGVGREAEPYEGIGRGSLNIEHLPVYRDGEGAFATPTSDSTRTMMGLDTTHLLMLINGYDGDREWVEKAVDLSVRLLTTYADAQNVSTLFY